MTVKITYADFLDLIAEKSGRSHLHVDRFMHTLIGILHEGLDRDGHVAVRGLGRFELRWQKERAGRNPQTGEPIDIPAHYRIHFKPDAELRRFFNRGYAKLKPRYLAKPKEAETDADIRPAATEPAPAGEPEIRIAPVAAPVSPSMPGGRIRKPRFRGWMWITASVLIVLIVLLLSLRKGTEPPASRRMESPQVLSADPAETSVQKTMRADAPAFPGGSHTVAPGDQLWSLSGRYYNNQYLWPYIYGENDTVLENPDLLGTSLNLTIPPLYGESGNLTPGDREHVAEGYLRTYLTYKNAGKRDAHTYLWTAYKLGGEDLVRRFSDRIGSSDIDRVRRIRGEPRI